LTQVHNQRGLTTRLSYKWQHLESRITAWYKPSKAHFILKVEDDWSYECYDDPSEYDETTFVRLYKTLHQTIDAKAKKYERRFGRNGYTYDDFASVMWEKARLLARDHHRSKGDYALYETLLVSLDNAVRDYLRKEKRYRERVQRYIELEKSKRQSEPDVADTVVDLMVVQQILSDQRLSDEERKLLQTIYENPDDKPAEIARKMGFQYRVEYDRMLKRIRRKLVDYCADW
jgi:hypothetical protein